MGFFAGECVCVCVCFTMQCLTFIWYQLRIAFGAYVSGLFDSLDFRVYDCICLGWAWYPWIGLLAGPFFCFVTNLMHGCGWGILDKIYKLRSALGTSWLVDRVLPHVWIVLKFTLELNNLFCNPNKSNGFEFGHLHSLFQIQKFV